jgi:sarcosine oxidase
VARPRLVTPTRPEHRDVVVVGAGLLGLAAGRALARRGVDVTVLDQASPGHVAGGSKGSCRVFRFGYNEPLYVTLVRQATPFWAELEDAAGGRLLHPTPQLTFGSQMGAVRDAMRQAGAACEQLSAEQAAERFPGVASIGEVLLEPDSAVIAADRTLAALARSVPEIRVGVRVTGLADDGRRVLVSTMSPDGSTRPEGPAETASTSAAAGGTPAGMVPGQIEADRVIVCAGPWTAGLLAAAGISVPAVATSEQVAYLVPAGRGDAAVPGMPIFIHHGEDVPYGLPVPGSRQYKIGIHHDGVAVDPDHQVQTADAGLNLRIEQAARRFLPAFDPSPVSTERCVYDNSPDTDFVVDRIGNVVIGSGTSGHGFKFGPLIGEWLAALAAGRPSRPDGADLEAGPVPDRFALQRFSTVS